MSRPLRVGLSTCPNDTFAFHGLLEGRVPTPGLELEFLLGDVEDLNARMAAGELDASKVSFHAALVQAREVVVLPAGSALGFGVGPLLLARAGRGSRYDPTDAPRVLCPGALTTATLLFRLFHPEPVRLEQEVFSRIMPTLQAGSADYGVCIHEGRFTWEESGLGYVEDLGTRWEERTDAALPLGGIVARADLPLTTRRALADALRRSLLYGLEHREETLPTLRRYAQEHSDAVLWAHVDLYVNEWTVDLGEVGRTALGTLARLAAEVGLTPPGTTLAIQA